MPELENIESLLYFSPEILLVIFAVAVILLDLVVKNRESNAVAHLSLVGCLCVLAAVLFSHFSFSNEGPVSLFLGMIRLDVFASFFKILLLLATAATILFSLRSEELDARLKGEYYALLLAITLGMFLMASSTNLLMIFISLETVSLTSYILAGFLTHNPRSSEAAFKIHHLRRSRIWNNAFWAFLPIRNDRYRGSGANCRTTHGAACIRRYSTARCANCDNIRSCRCRPIKLPPCRSTCGLPTFTKAHLFQ